MRKQVRITEIYRNNKRKSSKKTNRGSNRKRNLLVECAKKKSRVSKLSRLQITSSNKTP